MASRRFYFNKILSLVIALGVLSVILVSALPIFAKFGHNQPLKITGILFNTTCIIFLMYELNLASKLISWSEKIGSRVFPSFWSSRFWQFLKHMGGFHGRYPRILPLEYNPQVKEPHKPEFLAYFFFIGYSLTQTWCIINGIHLLVNSVNCESLLGLIHEITKILLSVVMMMNSKEEALRPENPSSFISYVGWCTTIGVFFSSAFKCVIQNAIFAYVLYTEHSHGGVPPSSSPAFMIPILELIIKCEEKTIIPGFNAWNMEINAAFGTEFFCLATFYSFSKWQKLDQGQNEHSPVPAAAEEIEADWEGGAEAPCASQAACSFGIERRTAFLWIGFMSLITMIFVVYFFILINTRNPSGAMWILTIQNALLQGSIFGLELTYYRSHLRKMTPSATFPARHKLDLLLLIFPLFPAGINYALLDLPFILKLCYEYPGNLWNVLWETVYIIFKWGLVAFQVIFMAELLATDKKEIVLRPAKNFFMILASLNFFIWLSWSLECPLRTIFGLYTGNYTVLGSILIVYATIPFVLFNFAHATSLFLELL